jgi:hypothetical protein
MVNADKPHRWKADITASVHRFSRWFLRFAPKTFRDTRAGTTLSVGQALILSADLTNLTVELLSEHQKDLPTLRMWCCPPLARDRLIGLAKANRSLVGTLERGVLPPRIALAALRPTLRRIVGTVRQLLDIDVFPWLAVGRPATETERHRASTIVADRLCGAVADPIIRNAQVRRQLNVIRRYLRRKGYRLQAHLPSRPLTEMEPGTFTVRMSVVAGAARRVKVPVDVAIQPKRTRVNRYPALIEAKSAGDSTRRPNSPAC